MNKYSVNVLGCCISRDPFNSSFVQNYKNFFSLKIYIPRNPIPTFCTNGINSYIDLLQYSDTPWNFEVLFKSLYKDFYRYLGNSQTDLLLLDFYYDAFKGVIKVDNNYFVNDTLIINIFDHLKIKYHPIEHDYFNFWCCCFSSFMSELRQKTNARIIINTIKGQMFARENKRLFSENFVQRINSLWSMMDNYAISNYNLDFLSFDKKYYIDPNYPYGGSGIVHFEKEYYNDFFQKLLIMANNQGTNQINKNLIQLLGPNLIKNSDFLNMNFSFWHYSNFYFQVINKFGGYWFSPSKPIDSKMYKFFWLWSDPIEVQGNGVDCYEFSFNYFFSKPKSFSISSMFAVREFSKPIFRDYKDSLNAMVICPKISNNPKIDTVYHHTEIIRPQNKWLRVGIHLEPGCLDIAFTNIQLSKVIQTSN